MLQLNKNIYETIGSLAIFSPHWNQMGLYNKHGKSSRYGAKALVIIFFNPLAEARGNG